MSAFSRNKFNSSLYNHFQYSQYYPCFCYYYPSRAWLCSSYSKYYEIYSNLPEMEMEKLNDVDIVAKTRKLLNIVQPSKISKSPDIKNNLGKNKKMGKDDDNKPKIVLRNCVSNEKKKKQVLIIKKK